MPLSRTLCVALPCLLLLAGVVQAGADPAKLCEQAAEAAAKQTGVPYRVLLAVSVVETGRNQRPWPWTVNLAGEGHWFQSAGEAADLVDEAVASGATNIDLGCFQLNYRWHADKFASVADMLDPAQNATYAAEYLAAHYARTGDWALAAAAYHSATPEHADRYRARYEETVASLEDPAILDDSDSPGVRVNGFPLLVSGSGSRNGSLVPATSGGLRLIGGP